MSAVRGREGRQPVGRSRSVVVGIVEPVEDIAVVAAHSHNFAADSLGPLEPVICRDNSCPMMVPSARDFVLSCYSFVLARPLGADIAGQAHIAV